MAMRQSISRRATNGLPLKLAIYHNLGPGGALRVVEQQVLHHAPDISYDLFEPEEALERRKGAAIGSRLTESCDRHIVIPSSNTGRRRPRIAPDLQRLARHDRMERSAARTIDRGGYDLVMVHPDARTYTPGILTYLETPAVYFMQEPPRFIYEAPSRRRRRPIVQFAGHPVKNAVSESSRRLFETTRARRDVKAATAPGVTLVCNSLFSAESIVRTYGVRPHVCYLGVDPDTFQPGPEARENSVLAVGGIEPNKRHDLVVDALALLPETTRPSLHVVFECAAAGQLVALQDQASRQGVDLHLHASISEAELADLYQRVLATMCVARLEPFGLTTLESLASGTPVVAVREGGPREVIVEGRNGMLVDPTPASVAQGIERMQRDRTHYAPARLRAEIDAGEWRWTHSVRRLEDILRSCLDPR